MSRTRLVLLSLGVILFSSTFTFMLAAQNRSAAPTAASTTTALATSPNPSYANQAVTMTATVSSSGGTPTGTVQFYDAATLITSASLNGSGVATLNYAKLPVGTHSITAKYLGNASFGASTSNAVSQVVNSVATTTALTVSPAATIYGAAVTMTATVTPNTGTVTPTGDVQFYDGATFIETIILNSSGVAVLTDSKLAAGTHSLTAKYLGSATDTTSTSSAKTETVTAATTSTALTTSPNPSTSGTAVTFTATVTSPNGKTPSGTAQFFNGTAIITGVNLNASGVATLSYSGLSVGTHSITAKYLGNADYDTSTSSAVSQVVNAATKPVISSFTANPTSITSGSSSTLSWVTSGATSLAITPGTFMSTSASGSTSVSPTETTTYTLTAKNTAGSATAMATVTVTASGGPLTIDTTSCPGGTQGAAYAGCTIVASGGVPPYTYSIGTSASYPPLPEGMSLDESTGSISSSLIGGQGAYTPEFIVKDSTSTQATANISFAINGSNAFLPNIFPSTSIFHHRVDAATTGLPVDTSPAAPIYNGYLSSTVKPFFGNNSNAPFPNGIPAIEVPYNQPDVSVTTTVYQSYFTSGPIPAYAPVEGTSNSTGDRHVLVYLEAGDGNNPALYEMWQGIYEGGPWTDSSNALWPDAASNALTPQGDGTSDAAGLPVAPLLANADEVIGNGTPSAPKGAIQHPIRFTLNHMLNYWVWPATQTAGVGSCTASGGGSIPTESEISQSSPPASCTMTGPAGEIYRLKASVATPACASSSPQAAIIITAFRDYGIILADNGDSGGLIGTPDARWNDTNLSCITSLILSDFEPVNVSSLIVSNDSGATQ
jgi:Bacterial Ig-like domain (group 3)